MRAVATIVVLLLSCAATAQEAPPPTPDAPPSASTDAPPAPTDAPPADPAATSSDAAAPAAAPSTAEATPRDAAPPPPAASAPAAAVDEKPARRLGDPVPLTQREPTLPQLGLEVGARYGLVGTGPTRFTDDIRFGAFDWLELRTSLLPLPQSLMARGRIGSQQGEWGALLVDAGLAHFDTGFRLVPEEGEAEAGFRFHWEGGLAYAKSFTDRIAMYAQVHYRWRLSLLRADDQHAVGGHAVVTYDLLPSLAVTGGLGAATTIGTPVRELGILFVETGRPGMSHLLSRNDHYVREVTVPVALTYGRVENFDVDLFATTRVYPRFDILFGAGVRWRVFG